MVFTRLYRLYIGKMTTPIFEDPRDQGLKKISGTQHDYRLILMQKELTLYQLYFLGNGVHKIT